MPIKIPNDLPAVKTLNDENIFVMTETRAITQDIRPLKILLLNLMPKKIETETQISRLLGNSPLQVDLEFLHTKSHVSKNTSAEHLFTFYKTFEDVDRIFCRSVRKFNAVGSWNRIPPDIRAVISLRFSEKSMIALRLKHRLKLLCQESFACIQCI